MVPPLVRPIFRRPAALLLALLLAACGRDATDAFSPAIQGPSALLSDGSRVNGNPDFFFLPPLVANPSGSTNWSAGKFVGGWRPVVQVCRLGSGVTPTCATPWLRTWVRPEIGVGAEQYHVGIDTREAWATPGVYRIRVALVLADTVQLGFADVQLYDSPQVRNTITGDVIPLNDGRTLPLKFRIEQGVAVASEADFVEATVSADGGVIATSNGGAGLYFSPGWLPSTLSEVIVTIERRAMGPGNDCHGLGAHLPWLQQFEGCYRVETYPKVGILQAEVIVGVCRENLSYEPQMIYKSDPLPTGGNRVKALQPAAIPTALAEQLNCDTFAGTPPPMLSMGPRARRDARTMLAGGASWLLGGMGRLLTPQSAYALDAGSGGRMLPSIDDLSDFGWAVPTSIAENAGAGQSGAPGATLATPMTVRAFGSHIDGDGDSTWLAGVPVTFTASAGGFYDAATETLETTRVVMSDANGYAAAPLTLPYAVAVVVPSVTVTATIANDSSNNPVAVVSTRTVSFVASIVAPVVVADSIELLRNTGSAAPVYTPDNSPLLTTNTTSQMRVNVLDATPGPTVDQTPTATCTWSASSGAPFTITASSPTTFATLVAGPTVGSGTLSVTCNGYTRNFTVGITSPIL